jgi:CO/xanthine dehydrogenase FAD-binding subunit
MMKLRIVSPKHIIDLGKVGGLRYIKEAQGKVKLGPMTTHNMIESSPLIREKCPILSEAAVG